MGFLNELLLDANLIKPTNMVARFVKFPTDERCYRGRSAAASIRPTDTEPVWLSGALSDFEAMAVGPEFVYRPDWTLAAEREVALGQMTAVIEERDIALVQRNSLVAERDMALAHMTAAVEERDATLLIVKRHEAITRGNNAGVASHPQARSDHTDERAELTVEFTSLSEWTEWNTANPYIFESEFWVAAGARIRSNGFEEPLAGRYILPEEIEGPLDQFREGFLYEGINARLRAVMQAIESAIGTKMWADINIYTPEAITPFALRMRGLFPRLVTSEYSSDPDIRDAMFPIQFEDLTQLSFPPGIFDLVVTNEVLEHVPDLDQSMCEMARILKPGGWHIGTLPFAFFSEESDVRARLVDGKVEHLKPPEFHGNPFDDAGSLVFEIPGWDILDRCRRAGFSYAAMRYCRSERYGYVAEHIGGIFMLCCRR
jgi:hypothetical protein